MPLSTRGPESPAVAKTDAAAAAGPAAAPAAPTEASGILGIGDKYTSAKAPEGQGRAAAGSPARPKRRLRGTDTDFRTPEAFKSEIQQTRGKGRRRVDAIDDDTTREDTRRLPYPSEDEDEPPKKGKDDSSRKGRDQSPDKGKDPFSDKDPFLDKAKDPFSGKTKDPFPGKAKDEPPAQKQEKDRRPDLNPFEAADQTADLEATAQRFALRPFPETALDLKRAFRDLSRKSLEELEELHGLLKIVRDGTSTERAAALTRLASEFPSPLQQNLRKVGIENPEIEQILELPGFLKHSATLSSTSETPLDRIGAALGLANGLKQLLPRAELPGYLEKAAPTLPVARDIVRNGTALGDTSRSEAERLAVAVDLINDVQDLIPRENLTKFLNRFAARLPLARDLTDLFGTLLEEQVDTVQKATAVLQFARSAQAAVGDEWPALAVKLGKLRTPGDVVRTALTLLDPDSSLQEKAASALMIWTAADGMLISMSALRDGLQHLQIPHAADIAYTAAAVSDFTPPPRPAPKRRRKTEVPPAAPTELPLEVQMLPPSDKEAATAAAPAAAPAAPATEAVGPKRDENIDAQMSRLLQNVDHFSQVHNLLKSFERLDPMDAGDNSTRKALLAGLSGMQEASLRSVLADTLEGKPVVGLLVEVLQKLPSEEAKEAAAELLKDLDAGAVRLFLKLSSQVSIEVLGQLFRGQETQVGLNAIGDAINTLADVLRNPERAAKVGQHVTRQAIEGLQKLAEAVGEVGVKARKTLETVIQDFKLSGERGLIQLSEMALGSGIAAVESRSALADLGARGILAEDPFQRELATRALEALNEAAKLHPEARQEMDRALAEIGHQGEDSLEILRLLARTSGAVGEAAQRELLNLVLKGGAAAENAYQLLVGLEETGVEALGKLRRYALKHGEKAIDVLDWIVRHPGKGGDTAMRDAVHSLQDIAEVEERVGRMAISKLIALAEEKVPAADAAVEALVGILQSGPMTAGEVVAAWKGQRTPGSQKVLDSLVLHGEPGAEGLRMIADGGGELGEQAQIIVGDVYDGVLDVLGSWSLDVDPND